MAWLWRITLWKVDSKMFCLQTFKEGVSLAWDALSASTSTSRCLTNCYFKVRTQFNRIWVFGTGLEPFSALSKHLKASCCTSLLASLFCIFISSTYILQQHSMRAVLLHRYPLTYGAMSWWMQWKGKNAVNSKMLLTFYTSQLSLTRTRNMLDSIDTQWC